MAGIKGGRVDYGDKGPAGKSSRTGSSFIKQDSSVVNPTRAQRPVSKKVSEFTSEKADAMPKTRPNSGGK